MESEKNAALLHVRVMETRIEKQKQSIERLAASGQDTSEPLQRLALLQSALEEMRLQIAQLMPTTSDGARPAFLRRPPGRKK